MLGAKFRGPGLDHHGVGRKGYHVSRPGTCQCRFWVHPLKLEHGITMAWCLDPFQTHQFLPAWEPCLHHLVYKSSLWKKGNQANWNAALVFSPRFCFPLISSPCSIRISFPLDDKLIWETRMSWGSGSVSCFDLHLLCPAISLCQSQRARQSLVCAHILDSAEICTGQRVSYPSGTRTVCVLGEEADNIFSSSWLK